MCILYFRYTISFRYVSLWIYLCLCIILDIFFYMYSACAATSDSSTDVTCICSEMVMQTKVKWKKNFIYLYRYIFPGCCFFFSLHMQNHHLYFRKRFSCTFCRCWYSAALISRYFFPFEEKKSLKARKMGYVQSHVI